ncbi:hypothetical protein U1Q18_010302, partial [Sarracenia purpurea var. burkii]
IHSKEFQLSWRDVLPQIWTGFEKLQWFRSVPSLLHFACLAKMRLGMLPSRAMTWESGDCIFVTDNVGDHSGF